MNVNGSFKRKRIKFSQVSNEVLRNKNLSLKSKGLYSLIQSYITLENFTLYKNTLKKQCKEGYKAFESAWKELKDQGYLIQEKYRDSKGNFYYLYDLLDEAIHTPKKEGMEKGGGGKGGIYNNTDFNNTDFNNTYLNKGSEKRVSLDSFIKQYKLTNQLTELEKDSIEALHYYCIKFKSLEGTVLSYTYNQWADILNNIFETDIVNNFDELEILEDAIDKHFETKYKHKEMYLLHNFIGITKNNRLYEAGIL